MSILLLAQLQIASQIAIASDNANTIASPISSDSSIVLLVSGSRFKVESCCRQKRREQKTLANILLST